MAMPAVIGKIVKFVAGAAKNQYEKSAIGKAMSGGSGESTTESALAPETFKQASENTYLHPMAQKAMSLDMGFYKHMDSNSISKGKPIMGGINGPCKCKGGR